MALMALLPLVFLSGQQPTKGWRKFVSADGGYVAYFPEPWHVLAPDEPTLYVVNFPPSQRVRAVIRPDKGASISITPAPNGMAGIEEWISHNFRSAEQQSKNPITLQTSDSKQQMPVTEVVWHEDSTGVVEEGVDCYFEISKHLFLARLEYWKGDSSALHYREVLHQMVERTSLLQAKAAPGKN